VGFGVGYGCVVVVGVWGCGISVIRFL